MKVGVNMLFENFYFDEYSKLYDYIGYTVDEFLQKYDMYEVTDLQLGTEYKPIKVYVNENDEVPYLIVDYYDSFGYYGVIGCKVDKMMTYTEMLKNGIIHALNFNEFYNTLKSFNNETHLQVCYNDYDEYKITTYTKLDCGCVRCELEILPINLVMFKMTCKNETLAYFQVNFDEIEKTTDMLKHILVNTEW